MPDNKLSWHRRNTALLTRVAKRLGIPTKERTIRSNKAGPAVGGEVTMSAPTFGVYINLNCPWTGYGDSDPCGANYARRATTDDPYGTGMDKPNSMFDYSTEDRLVELLRKIAE